jgi:hypothetical protein
MATLRSSSLALLAVGAMAAATLTGCSSSDTPPEPLITTPANGTAYMVDNYQKDSLGQIDQSSKKSSVRTIISTNATVSGKTGVVQYYEDADTTSLHFESNGDVSFLQPAVSYPDPSMPIALPVALPAFHVPARWVLFGYGSKQQNTIPGYDTSLSVSGPLPVPIPVNIHVTGTTSYIGSEDMTISNGKIATHKALLTVDVNFTSIIASGSIQTVDTIWFAPKLGMFVKDDGMATAKLPATFGGDRNIGGTYNILTSYATPK